MPTPTFPDVKMAELVLSPTTFNLAIGDDVPMPILPVPEKLTLNAPCNMEVFAVSDPPNVIEFPDRVNPLANDNGFSKSVPAVAADNIPDVDFTKPVPKLERL